MKQIMRQIRAFFEALIGFPLFIMLTAIPLSLVLWFLSVCDVLDVWEVLGWLIIAGLVVTVIIAVIHAWKARIDQDHRTLWLYVVNIGTLLYAGGAMISVVIMHFCGYIALGFVGSLILGIVCALIIFFSGLFCGFVEV